MPHRPPGYGWKPCRYKPRRRHKAKRRFVRCPECGGSGMVSETQRCPECKGSGRIRVK